jgi:cytochrome c-type biogenesis protein CcmE
LFKITTYSKLPLLFIIIIIIIIVIIVCLYYMSKNTYFYYMDNSVLPETKRLVFSIFSLVKIWKSYVPNVPYVRACPQFVYIIKRTLHVAALARKILFSPLENKIHIFAPPCNILYIFTKQRINMTIKNSCFWQLKNWITCH